MGTPSATGEPPAPGGPPDATAIASHKLPDNVLEVYSSMGMHSLYPWQAEALARPGVLEGDANLLYTAPTSGGKTLVAELLVLRRLLEGGAHSKARFVLPFRAVVAEKAAYFRRLLEPTKLQVADYYDDEDESGFVTFYWQYLVD